MASELYKNKYKSEFEFSEFASASIFRLFSEYFNNLISDEPLQKKQGIKVVGFIKDKDFINSVRLEERYGDHQILLGFEDLLINLNFEVYKQHGEVFFHIYMTSNKETQYDSESFYKKLLAHAVEVSNLKGSMFTMPRNELSWSKTKMQSRGFEDIFLPQTNIEDLKLYIQAGIELDVLMRYLMVGNPGTGKTEATTVLSNILNKEGITVIKTVVCDKIKEKFELASLLAPSIVILDDIDLSLGSRNKGVFPERLQDFLDILDGTEKLNKNVGIIATTNSTALLDLAAQRPGRFDKILLFNQLTKDNVKSIVLKSLKDNFKIKSAGNKFVSLFSDSKIINLLFNSSVTGAYIYTTTRMLKMKIDMLRINDTVDIEWLVKEIRSSMDTISKVKNADFLNDKLSNSTKNIGFESEEAAEEIKFTEQDIMEGEDSGEDNENYKNTRKKIIEKFKKSSGSGYGGLLGSDDDDEQ